MGTALVSNKFQQTLKKTMMHRAAHSPKQALMHHAAHFFGCNIRSKCNWVEAIGMLARARRDAAAFEAAANTLQCSFEPSNTHSQYSDKANMTIRLRALPQPPGRKGI